MLGDDRGTHTDHVGVRQQPCSAILCLPYASRCDSCRELRLTVNNFFRRIFCFHWDTKHQKTKGRPLRPYAHFCREVSSLSAAAASKWAKMKGFGPPDPPCASWDLGFDGCPTPDQAARSGGNPVDEQRTWGRPSANLLGNPYSS